MASVVPFPGTKPQSWLDSSRLRRADRSLDAGAKPRERRRSVSSGRWRWWLALAAAVGLTLAVIVSAGPLSTQTPATQAAGAAAMEADVLQAVYVQQGDTLWQLAIAYGPEGQDVRETVWALQQLNGLSSGQQLQVGQIVWVPGAAADGGVPAVSTAMER